jgi:hemerythrin superfamily protein
MAGVTTRLAAAVAQGNVVELVMQEHRLVESLYWEYKNSEDIAVRQNKIHHIIKELSQHAAKEEMVLYPAMKQKLPQGEQLVNHALTEHQQVKEALYQIDQMDLAKQPEADQLLHKCIADVLHHVQEEESELLPQFQKFLSAQELDDLTKQWIAAAGRAPSRPHPAAPNEGPLAEAANVAAKAVDALRDTSRDLTKDSGMIGIAPKPSGDSAVLGAKTMEVEPNPSIEATSRI